MPVPVSAAAAPDAVSVPAPGAAASDASAASRAVVLRFAADVHEPDLYVGMRTMNHDLLLGFRKLGVEVPFPQVDVHFDKDVKL